MLVKLTSAFVSIVAMLAVMPIQSLAQTSYWRSTANLVPDPCAGNQVFDQGNCRPYKVIHNWGGVLDPISDDSTVYYGKVASDGTVYYTEMSTIGGNDPATWTRRWFLVTVNPDGSSTRVELPQSFYSYELVGLLNDKTLVARNETKTGPVQGRYLIINSDATLTEINIPVEFFDINALPNNRTPLLFDNAGNIYTSTNDQPKRIIRYNFKTKTLDLNFVTLDANKYYYRMVIDAKGRLYVFYSNSDIYKNNPSCTSDAAGYLRVSANKSILNYGGDYKFSCNVAQGGENFMQHGGRIAVGNDGRLFTAYMLPNNATQQQNMITRTSLSVRLNMVHPNTNVQLYPATIPSHTDYTSYLNAYLDGQTKLIRVADKSWYYKELITTNQSNSKLLYWLIDIDAKGNLYFLANSRDGSIPTTITKIEFGSI